MLPTRSSNTVERPVSQHAPYLIHWCASKGVRSTFANAKMAMLGLQAAHVFFRAHAPVRNLTSSSTLPESCNIEILRSELIK